VRKSGYRAIGSSGDLSKIAGIAGIAGIARDRHAYLNRVGSRDQVLRVTRWFRDLLRIVAATLREIFDESAYERFLLRTESCRSVASYRRFLQEREALMARKPKCC
jgi:hypothetical protein